MLPIGRSHVEYLAHLDQYTGPYSPRAGHEELLPQLRRLNMEPAAALLRPFLYGRLWRAGATARSDAAVVRRDDPGRRHVDLGVGADARARTEGREHCQSRLGRGIGSGQPPVCLLRDQRLGYFHDTIDRNGLC